MLCGRGAQRDRALTKKESSPEKTAGHIGRARNHSSATGAAEQGGEPGMVCVEAKEGTGVGASGATAERHLAAGDRATVAGGYGEQQPAARPVEALPHPGSSSVGPVLEPSAVALRKPRGRRKMAGPGAPPRFGRAEVS